MKSPEDVIKFALEIRYNYQPEWGEEVVKALDAAGYVIVPKEPTEEMQRVASDYLGFHPTEPKGLAEAMRLSMWSAMIAAAQTQENPPS